MSEDTIKKVGAEFSYFFINEDEVTIPSGKIMITPFIEIGDGSLEIEGALEIL